MNPDRQAIIDRSVAYRPDWRSDLGERRSREREEGGGVHRSFKIGLQRKGAPRALEATNAPTLGWRSRAEKQHSNSGRRPRTQYILALITSLGLYNVQMVRGAAMERRRRLR